MIDGVASSDGKKPLACRINNVILLALVEWVFCYGFLVAKVLHNVVLQNIDDIGRGEGLSHFPMASDAKFKVVFVIRLSFINPLSMVWI